MVTPAAVSESRICCAIATAAGVVAVDADRVDLDRDLLAGDADHDAFLDELHDARHGDGRIVQDRSLDLARHQHGIVVICAVGKDFARAVQAQLLARLFQLAARHDDEQHVRVDLLDRTGCRRGQPFVHRRHVAERAVGLEMGDLHAERSGHRLDGADLVDHRLLDIIRALALDRTAAEPPQVVEPGMGADADAVFLGQRQGLVHDQGITTVEAASHIGRGDDLEHLFVVADDVRAEAFAEVRIQVDLIHADNPLVCRVFARSIGSVSGNGTKFRQHCNVQNASWKTFLCRRTGGDTP